VTDDTTFLYFSRLDNRRILVTAVTPCTPQASTVLAIFAQGFHMAALIKAIRTRSIALFHPYRWYEVDGAGL
jgi:hypothetical protein